MGMSTHVCGFVPPDDEYKKKSQAWKACVDAGVSPPSEPLEFFGYCDPDPQGTEVRIDAAVSDWGSESATGLEVDLSKVPERVKVIRFFNSW